ncbi:hypothetical protein AwWohl_08300 [Gammaproteobacteria bacterium]|nr:hypothetical protein AwWohl_08300 [Gammaproteobacteria bacterium]
MFVCICSEVTDTQINNYLDNNPEATIEMLKANLDVATHCGGCLEYIIAMLDSHKTLKYNSVNQDSQNRDSQNQDSDFKHIKNLARVSLPKGTAYSGKELMG